LHFQAGDVPVDGGCYWIKKNGMDIEIFYNIYKDYTLATACYYDCGEDSIDGFCTQRIGVYGVDFSLNNSIQGAIKDLFKEMKKQRLQVWQSKHPKTNQLAVINFFGPEQKSE